MKKRSYILFILLFSLVVSPSTMAADTVKIGALFPFSGVLALLGQESYNGATIASDIVNEKGGLWGKKIEWVKGDAVDPKAAMAECERLISVKGLKLIFGTYSSSRSYAASEVSERNKVIYWEQGAIADDITARGFKYLFRTIARAGDFGKMAAEFAHATVAPKLGIDPKNLKIAIMFEDSLYGTSVGTMAGKRAKELGMKVVASESYSAKTVDLSSVVMKFKALKPDVIIATSYLEDGLLFWRQARDLDLNVKAFIGTGACHGMPDWAKTFGKEGDYIFNIDPPIGINPAVYNKDAKARLKEFQDRFKAKFGHIPATHATAGFVAAWVLFTDVLPRAGSLDPEAVRQAALKVDIPKGGTVFGFGVKFAPPDHPAAGQNLRAHPALMQWQGQQMKVVYPQDFAVAKPLLPLPTWEQRAKGEYKFID
ncbi:MAG: ABC transporter substrate-binding protein [Deltaproteobacteria bacterium]|nr:ABC transporter substrate-binding protein [Deltaproteobacteria bacterium]MBW1961896.1 ABC transporter substrate-binding protein [Deltaproteobacteria bacterium]MBW1994624.1 ABC transporter substrate-binding protein [Deltaproteobacteria bacterium]MBW2153623.1 ABC transporter substrate-binding protein [Deltaproteobacteria bacterium]